MTDPSNLTPLIARIEEAEEGSRELDVDIAKHLGGAVRTSTTIGTRYQVLWPDADFAQGDDINELPDVPHFTASIDAIVGLIESEFDECWWEMRSGNSSDSASIYYVGGDLEISSHCGGASTPALALCSAFLRAVQAKRAPTPDTEKG